MATTPKVGGRNWRRARSNFARHVAQATSSLARIRHATHVEVARRYAADVSVELTAAIAAFNDLVAVIEANE